MDFRQTTQPTSRPTGAETPQTVNVGTKGKFGKRPRDGGKWFNVLNLVVLLGAAIIVAAVALAVARGGNSEFKYVNQSKYQAVFLNNGQVYFGNIDSLNNDYVRMTNIYYLTQSSNSSSNSNSNYSLVKLGCQQIHDPYDEMVINRSQVTFWENLQDSGKVVQSINQFKKQGVDCSQVSNQTQASSSNAQNSTNTGTGSNTANPTGSSSSK